jgi:tungstate transport system substrate-binding protein
LEEEMKGKIQILLSIGMLCTLLLAACAPAAVPTAVPATEAPSATEAPAATEAPTTVPTHALTGQELNLATTTSTQDSGLLDYLLPFYTQETGIGFKVVAVGSGQALQLGKDGNADVLLVHSPAAEKDFMAAGDGVRREDVMYNDFVIVGPASDPAGVKSAKTAAEAFTKISDAKAPFISRGDKSGTNTKELGIWKLANIDTTKAGDWYISSGQGMGETLTMADEKQAYTLSDRATYLTRKQNDLNLDIVMEGDKSLLNPYGVIAVDPAKNPAIQGELTNKFIDWLISVPTQEKIAQFGMDKFGMSLFNPNSVPWKEAKGLLPTPTP